MLSGYFNQERYQECQLRRQSGKKSHDIYRIYSPLHILLFLFQDEGLRDLHHKLKQYISEIDEKLENEAQKPGKVIDIKIE